MLYQDGKKILEGVTCLAIHPEFPQMVGVGFINHF